MHDSGGGPSSGGAGAPLLLPSSSGNLTPCASLTPQPARKKVMGTKPQQQQPYRINNCKFEQSMIRFLRELHSSRQYTDVALHAEGRLLHAHRVVLAAGSGYFSSLFSTLPATDSAHSSTGQNLVVALPNIKFIDLEQVVKFIYLGYIDLVDSQLERFVQLAKELAVVGMTTDDDGEGDADDDDEEEVDDLVEAEQENGTATLESRNVTGFTRKRKRRRTRTPTTTPVSTTDHQSPDEHQDQGIAGVATTVADGYDEEDSQYDPTQFLSIMEDQDPDSERNADVAERQQSSSSSTSPHQNLSLPPPLLDLHSLPVKYEEEYEDVDREEDDDDDEEDDDEENDTETTAYSNLYPAGTPGSHTNQLLLRKRVVMGGGVSVVSKYTINNNSSSSSSGSGGGPSVRVLEKPFLCLKCGKTYNSNKSLWRHKKFTCDEKIEFKCTVCGKIFSRSDNLRRHVVVAHHHN